MEGFPKYPSIENLYKVTDILQYKCVMTEKIHGTNVRFMYNDENGLVLGSRENIIYKDSNRAGELYGFTEYALQNLESKLKSSLKYHKYVFYGEFFGSSIQKGVKYSETKDLRIFDIRNPEMNFLDWEVVTQICEELDLRYVPTIDIGIFDLSYLESVRDNVSVVGKLNGFEDANNTWEGIVLKPVHMQLDKHGEWLMAKYKSEKWAENAKAPKVKSVDPDKVELQNAAKLFAILVVTPGRIATVIDHITRTGDSALDMKRTPEFLRELVKDVSEEHAELFGKLDKPETNAYNKAVSSLGTVAWKREVEERNLKGL